MKIRKSLLILGLSLGTLISSSLVSCSEGGGDITQGVNFNIEVGEYDESAGKVYLSCTSGNLNVVQEVNVIIIPSEGHKVISIKFNGTSLDPNTLEFNVKPTIGFNTLDVIFDEDILQETPTDNFTVRIETSIGGTISADKTSGKVGETINLKVVPEEGYTLSSLVINNTIVDPNTRIFTAIEGENVVRGIFTNPTKIFTISVTSQGNGHISVDKLSGIVGETVYFSVEPDNGYELSRIVINGDTVDNTTRSFNPIEGTNRLNVVFKQIETTPIPGAYVPNFKVELSVSSPSISIGEEIVVVATSTDENIQGIFNYEISSGSEFIDLNTDTGVVTGRANGTATIRATCLNMDPNLSVEKRSKTISVTVDGTAKVATGAFNYSDLSYKEKLDILGKLEKYAVDNHLTGITLAENGGYVMYSDRLVRPVNEYVPGYGMGILSEGNITEPMENESNDDWKMYYHIYGGLINKLNINCFDDISDEPLNLYKYIASGYYGKKLNKNKYNPDTGKTEVGYDWYPVLAKAKPGTDGAKEENFMPQPLDLNSQTNLATQYKVYLKTGEDGLVYNTASTKPEREKWKGRDVELEDYVTPFMLVLNGYLNLERSSQYISDSNNATLKGAKAFYDATHADTVNGGNVGDKSIQNLFYNLVGIKMDEEESSITFTFNTPVDQFTAMTNLSSTLNSPIPLEFIEELGNEYANATSMEEAKKGNDIYKNAMQWVYGAVNSNDYNYTPVDNVLSLGPYMLEAVDSTYNVYERNDKWFEFKSSDSTISSRYKIEGVKIQYIQAAASDPNAAFETFIHTGTLDAVSIPKDYMDQYISDPRTATMQGDSTFRLNLNTCTQAERDELFKDTKLLNDYTCKPLMANDDFVNALSFAIDRETFATKRGLKPSQSYFSSSYFWNPEKGYSYNETAQHKAAIAEYSPETYGYNKELATELFDRAIAAEIAAKHYNSYKDHETIDIYWMNTTDTREYGNEIAKYFEDAFKETKAYKYGFRIEFVNHNGTTNPNEIYTRMANGQFDLAFGYTNDEQFDPFGSMESFKSDNSSGSTLNWGIDTSSIEDDKIIYDGKIWSFDALWTAATKGVIVESDGSINKEPVRLEITSTLGSPADAEEVSYPAWKLSYRFTNHVPNSGLSFKVFADSIRKKDETVTISVSYKPKGETTSKTISFNVYYEDGYIIRNGVDTNTGTFEYNANFSIILPKMLNQETTGGQIEDEIDLTACDSLSVTIFATYYTEIKSIPVATTLTSANFKVI